MVRHPAVALLLSGVVILGLAIPALGMKTHCDTLDTLPASIPQVQTIKDISKSFPADEGASATVVVKSDGASAKQVTAALDDLTEQAVATGDFVASGRGVQTSADGTTSVIVLGMPYDETDPRVNDALPRAARRPGAGGRSTASASTRSAAAPPRAWTSPSSSTAGWRWSSASCCC